MPDPAYLLGRSADVERAIWVIVALVVALLLVRTLWARTGSARAPLAIGAGAERAAIAVLLVWVLGTRLVGLTSEHQPRWYFSQVSTLYVAEDLRTPAPLSRWLNSLKNLQVIWEHESPIQQPVAAAVQRVFGPSIELPTIVGSLWAVLSVLLAWRLGRVVETPAFGVLFAALVAVSPVQTMWARLGGIYIGASAGVLFALWTAWLVGRRRGVVAALLLGVVAWSCVYLYYPARVGMGLVFVSLWAGWHRSGRSAGRLVGLTAATLVGLAACALLVRAVNSAQTVWPAYGGYVGSRGETDLWALATSLWTSIRNQTELAVRHYFWTIRFGRVAQQLVPVPASWSPGSVLQPGITGGGLVLLPVLLLGAIGVLRCLRHPIERGLWLVFAVCGLLPPVLGFPSARRFLVLDVAWCALGALGLLGLLESRLLNPASGFRPWRWGAVVLVGVGLWSATSLALSAALLPSYQIQIPFAESGFGDGATCLGCINTARSWQSEIEDGRMVIYFDTDMYRENATAPGGIVLYGKTAALAAGRRDLLLEYYAIAANVDLSPPRPGPLAPEVPSDIADAIGARIETAKPRSIVWWFTQPNAWERRLVDVLAAAGSIRTSPPPRAIWGADRATVSSDPIRLETPWDRRGEALSALRSMVDPLSPRSCMRLERVATRPYPEWPLLLAPATDENEDPPQWAASGWHQVEVRGVNWTLFGPVALEYRPEENGAWTVDLVDPAGTPQTWTPQGKSPAPSPSPPPGPRPVGRGCAVLQDGQWWVVDPIAATLHLPGNPPMALPLDAVGIVRVDGRPVLATADQKLAVLDPTGRRVERSFPAFVAPPRRFTFGECAMLAAGRGWIASLDHGRGFLHFYDDDGTPLGLVRLAEAVGTVPRSMHTIRGVGDYLGVGHDTSITTFRVIRDSTCPTAGLGVRG